MNSLKFRLIGGFGLLVILVGLAGVMNRAALVDIDVDHNRTVALNTAVEEAILVQESLVLKRALQAEYAISHDPEILVLFEEAAEKAAATMDEMVRQFPDNPSIKATAQQMKVLDAEHDAIVIEEMVPAFRAGDERAGFEALGRAQAKLDELLEVGTGTTDALRAELNGAIDDTESGVEGASRATVIVSVAVIGLTLLVVLWNAIAILPPLRAVTRTARRLAVGDVSSKIETRATGGEFGVLVEAFTDVSEYVGRAAEVAESLATGDLTQHLEAKGDSDQLGIAVQDMVGNLRQIMRDLDGAAGGLSVASNELLSMSHDLSSAADQTSHEATSVSTASEELTHSMANVATEADRAAKAAGQAVQVVAETNRTIGGLAESSSQIGDIVGSIQDIAEQTNLLALNATIESARAGEAGKGFAVVANEVKDLATQTSAATTKIENQINAIQGSTQGAVTAIDSVSESINRLYETANSIANATREQSRVTGELTDNAQAIVNASLSTAKAAEAALSASTRLSEMANTIGDLLGRFQLESGGRTSFNPVPPVAASASVSPVGVVAPR